MGLIAVVSWILIDILYKVFLLVESYRLIMPLLSSIDCRPASTATKLCCMGGRALEHVSSEKHIILDLYQTCHVSDVTPYCKLKQTQRHIQHGIQTHHKLHMSSLSQT